MILIVIFYVVISTNLLTKKCQLGKLDCNTKFQKLESTVENFKKINLG